MTTVYLRQFLRSGGLGWKYAGAGRFGMLLKKREKRRHKFEIICSDGFWRYEIGDAMRVPF